MSEITKVPEIVTYNPWVLLKDSSTCDIFSQLVKNRILYINEDINSNLANCIIAQLIYLDSLSNDDITIYINSYGGLVTCGLAIYDIIKSLKSKVTTIAIGSCQSMGVIVLLAGENRYGSKNLELLIHQPSSDFPRGTAKELEINSIQLQKLKARCFEIVKENTKIENPTEYCEYDTYFTSEEALNMGIITKIL